MPIYLIFDGGKDDTLGCYGSYQGRIGPTLEDSEVGFHWINYERFPECETSNEAEYTALIRGLQYLLADWLPIEAEYCQLVIMGDSKLVLNQVSGEWRVRAKNLLPLKEKAVELASKFGEVVTKKLGREDIKEYLGH
jgi:ribonuclease HI